MFIGTSTSLNHSSILGIYCSLECVNTARIGTLLWKDNQLGDSRSSHSPNDSTTSVEQFTNLSGCRRHELDFGSGSVFAGAPNEGSGEPGPLNTNSACYCGDNSQWDASKYYMVEYSKALAQKLLRKPVSKQGKDAKVAESTWKQHARAN